MARDTEKIIADIKKKLESGELNIDGNGFSNVVDFKAHEAEAETAYDYLEKAEEADSDTQAVKYAKKALELDPTLLDAEYIIASARAKDMSDLQKRLEKVLKKGEQLLLQQGISPDTDAGEYYMLFETRPYMRVYKAYLDILVDQTKYLKAIDVAGKIISLNENDNMGVRFILMALYAAMGKKEEAEALYSRYEEASAQMLLPMVALYYKLDDSLHAKNYLKTLCGAIPDTRTALRMLNENTVDLEEVIMQPYYEPFTVEEIFLAYAENLPLYAPMQDFLNWAIKNCPKSSK